MSNPLIVDFRQIDIYQDEKLILHNVNLQIAKGEFVYVVGKVGAGKTTLMKAINAEVPVRKGYASVAGLDMLTLKQSQIPPLRRKLGVVFQDFKLLTDRSVHDNLLFVLKATGWRDDSLIRERIHQVLDAVGMKEQAERMPHQLSGGEQQRVAISRALLNNPELILADEPTGNLDVESYDEIMQILQKISAQYHTAIFMATHNQHVLKMYPARTLKCEKETLMPLDNGEEIDFSL